MLIVSQTKCPFELLDENLSEQNPLMSIKERSKQCKEWFLHQVFHVIVVRKSTHVTLVIQASKSAGLKTHRNAL